MSADAEQVLYFRPQNRERDRFRTVVYATTCSLLFDDGRSCAQELRSAETVSAAILRRPAAVIMSSRSPCRVASLLSVNTSVNAGQHQWIPAGYPSVNHAPYPCWNFFDHRN